MFMGVAAAVTPLQDRIELFPITVDYSVSGTVNVTSTWVNFGAYQYTIKVTEEIMSGRGGEGLLTGLRLQVKYNIG